MGNLDKQRPSQIRRPNPPGLIVRTRRKTPRFSSPAIEFLPMSNYSVIANVIRLFRAVRSNRKYVLAAVKINGTPERLQLAQALLINILAVLDPPGLGKELDHA